MSFPGALQARSWQPAVTADTTDSRYWLNWRMLLSGVWVLAFVAAAIYLIWRFEGPERRDGGAVEDDDHEDAVGAGVLYDDEPWRPCLREIHPSWLLGFRLTAFFLLLGMFVVIVIVDRIDIFLYYTQWTFILITIYFGLGSLLSMNGCIRYASIIDGEKVDPMRSVPDADQAAAESIGYADENAIKVPNFYRQFGPRRVAGFWGYLFQIMYQTNAGAVMLTDGVFWIFLFPFLTEKSYGVNLLRVGMHSINAIFLLGDTALNSLRFPAFRVAYFFLWTGAYVVFQWITHASMKLWWPYPFLDLSSPRAPLWYLAVAVMQIPCYAVFLLLTKMKHFLLSRWFPESYDPIA